MQPEAVTSPQKMQSERRQRKMTRKEYMNALHKELETGDYTESYKEAIRTIISWTPKTGDFTAEALEKAIGAIRSVQKEL